LASRFAKQATAATRAVHGTRHSPRTSRPQSSRRS
jgi:hypothetical protein